VKLRSIALTAVVAVAIAGPAQARAIKIVGSSTVFPYTQAVSEEYANNTGNEAPIVESTGTGGGMKAFCAGVGEAHPDITGASRAMKQSEYDLCQSNGVNSVSEALIGYDGLSIGVSKKSTVDWDLSEVQLYKALIAEVPVAGGFVPNPYKKWSDIDSSLPDIAIRVYGPPPTSGTRDAFVELAMHDGCKATGHFKKKKDELDKKAFKSYVKENCSRMRTDGPFIEAGENDNLIVQRLNADETAFGIFGYSFLFENQDTLKAVKVDGVAPSFETIADNSYDIARPLFFYVKNQHRGVIEGMEEFLNEYVSDGALAPGGYLSERGLTPLSDELRTKTVNDVTNSVHMDRY